MRTPLQHAMVWGLIVVVGAHLVAVICMLGYVMYVEFARSRLVVTNLSEQEICVALTGQDDLLRIEPGTTGKARFRATFEAGFEIGPCGGKRGTYGYIDGVTVERHTIVFDENGNVVYDTD